MANNNTVKKKKVKMSTGDKVFAVINTIIMILVCIAIVYPLYYVLLASVTDPVVVSSGKILLYPEAWYTNGYETTLKYQPLWTGYANTIKYTVLGTLISLVCTIPAGYALSRYDMVGRKPIMFLFTFTMFFSGGLIPTYLLINNLGLLDSMWAVILPGAFSVWNMIIARTYYQGVPRELREAADVDGASEMLYFFKILLPVCMPVVAVLALWQFVAMWNSYFDAMIYLNSASKQPLQLVLRSILIQSQPESGMIADIQSTAERAKMAELLKYATIIISSLPLLVMYPFFQKYFDAGIMAGSIKG